MQPYDASYNPPAPVAAVTIRQPDSGVVADSIPILIDTGADITLLPRAPLENAGLSLASDKLYELVAFDGTRSFAPAVYLEMTFLRRRFKGYYVVIDGTHGVLGRDVLNHLSVTLDGPHLQWFEPSS